MDLPGARWLAAAASLAALLAPGAAAAAPDCTVVGDLGNDREHKVVLGELAVFQVNCTDGDRDLAYADWYLDGTVFQERSNATGLEASNFGSGTYFQELGRHTYQAVVSDAAGHEAPRIAWNLLVIAGPNATRDSPGGGAPRTGLLDRLDPVEAFSALVGGVVGVGGLVLAVVQHRRRSGGRGDDAAAAPSAPSVEVRQSVGTNSGTLIGQAGQVVLQQPALRVPAGVPPHKQDLYLALAQAHEALDGLPVGQPVLEARALAAGLMEDLARGEIPVREQRRPAAAAIQALLEGSAVPEPAAQALRAAVRAIQP